MRSAEIYTDVFSEIKGMEKDEQERLIKEARWRQVVFRVSIFL